MISPTTPTIVLSTEPVIRPPLRFDHFRLAAFPIVLRRQREGCGLSRAALASVAGLAPEDVADLESGVAVPALDVLFVLADVLGADAADLLHDTRRQAEELVLASWDSRRRAWPRTVRRGP
jgi:transcriptional regulator with XRE-family HTH domain